jgi:hypothetical protein
MRVSAAPAVLLVALVASSPAPAITVQSVQASYSAPSYRVRADAKPEDVEAVLVDHPERPHQPPTDPHKRSVVGSPEADGRTRAVLRGVYLPYD